MLSKKDFKSWISRRRLNVTSDFEINLELSTNQEEEKKNPKRFGINMELKKIVVKWYFTLLNLFNFPSISFWYSLTKKGMQPYWNLSINSVTAEYLCNYKNCLKDNVSIYWTESTPNQITRKLGYEYPGQGRYLFEITDFSKYNQDISNVPNSMLY